MITANHTPMRVARDLRTALAATLTTRLALDTQFGPWNRFETRHSDSIATHLAISIVATINTCERFFDFLDSLASSSRQREIAFSLHGQIGIKF